MQQVINQPCIHPAGDGRRHERLQGMGPGRPVTDGDVVGVVHFERIELVEFGIVVAEVVVPSRC